MQNTRLRGARTHNLQDIDLDLEPGSLVAVVGPSGAGKSSLAFGTLYAEGQRRYVESFSAYARQFLERLARPPVDELDPVPVGIAVDRQGPVRTSRSTVGTMTEIADYAKTLWSHAAELHCPDCGERVVRDAPPAAASELLERAGGEKLVVTYPLEVKDADEFLGIREGLVEDGYRRIRLEGDVLDLDGVRPSDVLATETPRLDVVADRVVARSRDRARLVEALEAAMARGGGRADVWTGEGERHAYSSGLHCAGCDRHFRDATPNLFSFNSPVGACETCRGFGRTIGMDLDRVLPDRSLTLNEGAIRAWHGKSAQWERRELKKQAKRAGIPMNVPVRDMLPGQVAWLIEGEGSEDGFWGLKRWFKWMESRAYKMHVRVFLSRYRKYETCEDCGGARLKAEALNWKIDDKTIPEFFSMPVADAHRFIEERANVFEADPAVALLLRETLSRFRVLSEVGLGYLTLDRASRTLSGGEAQRVALTGALGAAFNGAMFVLDEPTVGLHPKDVRKLFDVVSALAEGENVAVVVEHDPELIRGADRVIELGPGAGEHGGRIVFDGPPSKLARAATATGKALRRRHVQTRERRGAEGWLKLSGARGHNLRGVEFAIPRGALTCVTGVSGSGKSSLVLETLTPAAARALGKSSIEPPLPHDALEGADSLADVVAVDQSPLGRTSRGNPATYLDVWDALRKRWVREPLAKERGYKIGAFSFNVPGGRCEACKGEGAETVEMQFLADVTFSCPECKGRRFVGPVLDVRYLGKNAADALEMTAREAAELFADDRIIARAIRPLIDVGLGYLRLGQPLNTLSGGEAQRLKLASALAGVKPGSLIVLDEPTAGLHSDDVEPLLAVLDALVDRGDTVVVVEHDMRVAAFADHVVDLGPGPGALGGSIVASGTPEEVAAFEGSETARFLSVALGLTPAGRAPRRKRKAKGSSRDGAMRIDGAREHNLRGVDVSIPREKLVVVTGPSGSGKSSLAFDVLFAEAQRRYLETLTPYARQYMPQPPRPAVDRVQGVPPSVSLEQRVTRGGVNSTVATVTEVAHYLRVLWAKAGELHCPDCEVPIEGRSPTQLAADLERRFGVDRELRLFAPVVEGRKGAHRELLEKAREQGFREAWIDGEARAIEPGMKLDRYSEHDVALRVGAASVASGELVPLLVTCLDRGDGAALVVAGRSSARVSSRRTCPSCGTGYPELDPRFFSFNTKQGRCEPCEGRGRVLVTRGRGKKKREIEETCGDCEGTRLSPLARSVVVDERAIEDVLGLSVQAARRELTRFELEGREAAIGKVPLTEARRRLAFLEEVGLGYLGLDRAADTLSGGELQRVRLAAQLGSGLTGVLYVLDEPTIGLHPRDTGRLLGALTSLVERGNSVVVVEHDADTIRAADHIIDIGPGGGHHGGRVVAEGPPSRLLASKTSVTGMALSRPAPIPEKRRAVGKSNGWLELRGAAQHNLREVDLKIPLERLVAITGVSGSGKSTLVRDVLLRAVRDELGLVNDRAAGAYREVVGVDALARAVEIDQSPIGRTSRSVPATYVNIWDHVRRLLSGTPLARARGYSPSRFSFNVEQGRCPECKGQGSLSVEMAFLPDVQVPCESCAGARFSPETLDVRWREFHAGALLDLEVEDAVEVFSAVNVVRRPLELMRDLGLGYLKLGQPSNTLSGGEAQRLKLVMELSRAPNAGPSLYVMDEPTTGLHRDDVERLIGVLGRLVERGDTVVVIEHQPDVILASDWVVDLGPEGGEGGGRVVAQGAPEKIARSKRSHTGAVLRAEGLGALSGDQS